jgi:hypothetical protein
MNGRRALVGLCLPCALLVSALAAQSASAAGTTTYTCVKGGSGTTYKTPHCRPGDAAGEYSHQSIANGTTTEITGNNKDHEGKAIVGTFVSTAFGVTIELTAQVVAVSGTLVNSEEGGEMFASGSGTVTFTEVTVMKPTSCKVVTDIPDGQPGADGIVHTETLKWTTTGQGDRVKIEPSTGTTIARFWMEDQNLALCKLPKTTFTVSGSVQGTPNGATLEFTEADTTSQNTLKLNGAKAGIAGSVTIEGRDNSGDSYKPISATT